MLQKGEYRVFSLGLMGMFKRCGETDFNIMSSKNQSYIQVVVVIKHIIVSMYLDIVSVKGHLSRLVDQQ